MDAASIVILNAAAVIAAFFQSVTGIGFGMIAGPVILMVLSDPVAIVISTLMSWLIGLVLFPFLRRGADWALALRLLGGAVAGLPLGLVLVSIASVAVLKLICATAIAVLTAIMVVGAPAARRPGTGGDLAFGFLAGVFGGCLAMPGPTAVIRAAGLGLEKARVRATMVTFFAMVWPLIFAGQWLSLDIGRETFLNAAMLAPATLGGLMIGNWAASRASERVFRSMVMVFLVLTSMTLFVDALISLAGAIGGTGTGGDIR